ncbi:MAG TPA: M28 family peptidase [Terriglobia bacterium]|nr:M28 family peptidase [Terriglobia bacterium]
MEKRNNPATLLLVIVAALSTFYLSSLVALPTARPPAEVVSDLSAARYFEQVKFLSSDEMKGRGDGSPELDKAADYIASQFRTFGLRPMGDDNTYFQKFQLTTGAVLGPNNELELNGDKLKINQDFVPITFSDTASFDGALVFVGYGITAPELHYDDYEGISANGKIVVVLRHEPQESDPHSPFEGTNFTRHASFVNKAINAKQHGAQGIVFITDLNHEDEQVGSATRTEETDDLGIPAVHAKRAPLLGLFKAAGKDVAAIQKKIDGDLKPQSFDLPDSRVHISTDVVRTRKTVRNVLAGIPGSDPALKDEWVVVGAHYDHLGLGDRNSLAPSQIGQIHHGADDNASGTSGVLEIARLAAKNKSQWKRSVLLITFAGEELGLLGSSQFVNHPTVPLNNVIGMINMDMIGRINNDRLFVGGVGTSPNFKPWLEEFNQTVHLQLDYSDSGYGASDHMSFNSKKIPVLFFFSGLHTDYHKPTDTYDKINAAGAVKVLSLVYMMADRMGSEPKRLEYTEVQQPRPASAGSGGGYGPYFGSVPDFRDDLKGVLFADVQNNSPAAKAGLKQGDLLVEFDGKPVQNLYDFTYALRSKKVGDIVPVVVKRNGQDVKVNVTLEARR